MSIKKYNAGTYDVAVIGGGHAGIEAALAPARLGCKTIMFIDKAFDEITKKNKLLVFKIYKVFNNFKIL